MKKFGYLWRSHIGMNMIRKEIYFYNYIIIFIKGYIYLLLYMIYE